MRRTSNREFWFSLLAMLLIGGIYAIVVWQTKTIPAAAGLFGHLLGILGFIMMLMTEILYSLRKRSQLARWGRMSDWLQFHIFTGLVGPFMVLLHTSWKFNGLAGVVTLLTIIIVVSGFVGRYIYTRIPRTVEGTELESPAGESQSAALARARKMLSVWYAVHIPLGMALFIAAFFHIAGALYYATLLH
jgi:xanthosine utilization system XapX-like protein